MSTLFAASMPSEFGVQYKKWDDNVYNSASTYQGTIAFQGLENLLRGQANTFTQTIPGSDVGRRFPHMADRTLCRRHLQNHGLT